MKNLLGFVKENKKAIGLIAGAIATLIVGKKVSKKINAKMEKVEKEYKEMDEIIETTHEMNLPEYSEDDYWKLGQIRRVRIMRNKTKERER